MPQLAGFIGGQSCLPLSGCHLLLLPMQQGQFLQHNSILISWHRSHFGSRYTLGCCSHAGLFTTRLWSAIGRRKQGSRYCKRDLFFGAYIVVKNVKPGAPYLLGLLAMIKCSICSYQCDNWYVSNWRLACHIIFAWGGCQLGLPSAPQMLPWHGTLLWATHPHG